MYLGICWGLPEANWEDRGEEQEPLDIYLRGLKIQSGQRIITWLGSTNHDESIFADPERFDINRSNSVTYHHGHVGFGHGIHFCLGAPLARLEGQVVLKVILQRLQDLTLDTDSSEKNETSKCFLPRSSSFTVTLSPPITAEPELILGRINLWYIRAR